MERMPKKKGARAKGGLSGIPVVQLQAELVRRQRRIKALVKRYERIAATAAALRAEIDALGGTVNGAARGFDSAGIRRRPRNEMNLVEALQKLLQGKTMSVTEAAEKVQEAGYRTSSTTFRTIVNQTLINSGQFKRVGRGQYTAK
jgi:hypothetical protein